MWRYWRDITKLASNDFKEASEEANSEKEEIAAAAVELFAACDSMEELKSNLIFGIGGGCSHIPRRGQSVSTQRRQFVPLTECVESEDELACSAWSTPSSATCLATTCPMDIEIIRRTSASFAGRAPAVSSCKFEEQISARCDGHDRFDSRTHVWVVLDCLVVRRESFVQLVLQHPTMKNMNA